MAAALVALTACTRLRSEPSSSKLTEGFWYWYGSGLSDPDGPTADVLFVHAGTINTQRGPSPVTASLPDDLPAAGEYWLVFRYQRQGVPDQATAARLGECVAGLMRETRARRMKVAGIQLDVDSPTRSLKEYAQYLLAVQKQLPDGMQLSITALLDWFHPGTAVDEVVAAVDEFVPQFYDIMTRVNDGSGTAIAAKIDAARWGPALNRFHKRFRVGISTFGRARPVSQSGAAGGGYFGARSYRDLVPLEVATNAAFRMETARNDAGELILTYRATRQTNVGYHRFSAGEGVQFTLATPEHVRAAVDAARAMGGNLTGVVFFRWPERDERIAMEPQEVRAASGLSPSEKPKGNRVSLVPGECAAVECVDVYFEGAHPFAAVATRYVIGSSRELDYFIPEERMPVRMMSASRLELKLPPYCGRGRLYLGRAVSKSRVTMSVEEGQ